MNVPVPPSASSPPARDERLQYEHTDIDNNNPDMTDVAVELVPEQPIAGTGAGAPASDVNDVARRAARRARRAARKAAKEAEAEAAAAVQLEKTARQLFLGGFLALPMLWFVSLIYFYGEHKSPDANPKIKKWYKLTIVFFSLYTALFLAWFVTFQLYSETRFRNINIIYANHLRSPFNH